MKKKLLILILAAVAAVSFALFAGCNNERKQSIPVSCELGQVYDLSGLSGAEDIPFYEFTVTSPAGENVVLADSNLYLGETGNYTVTAGGNTWTLTVTDTQGPVVLFAGSLKDYFTGDTVELPDIRVRDYSGDIADYDVSVTLGEDAIALTENNTFVAERAGTYTLRVSAKDAANNPVDREAQFRVFRYSDEIVPADTQLSLTDEDFGSELDESKTWTISYKVYQNGSTTELGSTSFSVESGDYYEVYGTATEPGGEQVLSYTVYRAEDLAIMTFNRTQDAVSYGATATGAAAAVGSEENGNRFLRYTATGLSVTLYIPAVTQEVSIRNGSSVNVSLDCWLVGYEDYDFGSDSNHWLLQVGDVVPLTEGTYKARTSFSATVENGAVTLPVVVRDVGCEFYFDNITFENAGTHFAESSNPLVKQEIGSSVNPTPDLFGLRFTDFTGEELVPEIASVRRCTADGVWTEMSPTGPFTSETDYCYEIVYAAGEGDLCATYTVRLIVGNVDVEPPVIAFAPSSGVNRTVAPGTQIALSPDGLGFTVTDDNEYTLAYAVTRGGENVDASEGSITVNSGEYYEIVVTATDSEDNFSSQYIFINATDCPVVTFDTMSDDLLESLNYVCNLINGDGTTVNSTRRLVDENGNKSFAFSTGDTPRHLSLSWVAQGIASGNYDIRINFRFTGEVTELYLTNEAEQILDGQRITEDGYIKLKNCSVASNRFAFQLMVDVTGTVLVDSIVFLPAD